MPNGNASFLCVSGLFGGQRQEFSSRRLQVMCGRRGRICRSSAQRDLTAGRLAWRVIVETDDHGGIGNDDGIAALLRRNFQAARDRCHGHGAVRQFFCDR
jgi:hypothetical protein